MVGRAIMEDIAAIVPPTSWTAMYAAPGCPFKETSSHWSTRQSLSSDSHSKDIILEVLDREFDQLDEEHLRQMVCAGDEDKSCELLLRWQLMSPGKS